MLLLLILLNPQNTSDNKMLNTPKNNNYILSEYEGKLAIYKNGENMPISVYETYLSSLPEKDKELIEKGIIIESTEELQSLIEDYTS